jgi:penicillin-binding protein 1A
MTYAHQGIELRPLPGLSVPLHAPPMPEATFKGVDDPHPALLTRKGTDILVRIERLLDDANHALAAQSAPAGSLGALDVNKTSPGTVAAADRDAGSGPRGD